MIVVPARLPAARSARSREPEPVRALVIDRQPLFIAALGSLLAAPPLMAQIHSATRSDLAVEIVRRNGVNVVFCDVNAEPIGGSDLADLLARENPGVPVILLGENSDTPQLSAALSCSAAGFFTKDSGPEEFLVGVRTVLSGHRAVCAALMSQVLERLARLPANQTTPATYVLSPTEIEILARIGQAQSVSTIAAGRGISDKTVRNHLAKIYRKLHLHGRTEAVLWAARMGLIAGQEQ